MGQKMSMNYYCCARYLDLLMKLDRSSMANDRIASSVLCYSKITRFTGC